MTEFASARRHMVDGQIRTTDVTDLSVISAMLDGSARKIHAGGVDFARLSRSWRPSRGIPEPA